MKRTLNILYFIILLTALIFAQDNFYVKNGGGGANNGTSWTDAWTSFSSINWASIGAGDNLYIDGGTDSVVYNMTMNIQASGTWNNYINILPGKYSPSPSGHLGKVIIDHEYAGSDNGIQILGSTHGILIKGLIIRRTGSSGIYMYANATTANPYRIKIDSCTIYDVGDNECIEMLGYFSGTPTTTNMGMMDTTHHIHHVEISRNFMSTPINRAMGECNIIYGHLTGNIWVHHNTLLQRNYQEGNNDHIDPIQLSYSNYGWKIYNNIMYNDSCVTGHTMILGLMSRGSNYNDTTVVYNNFLYGGGEHNCNTNWKQLILWRAPEGDLPAVQYRPLVYSINNTIVARNEYTAPSAAEGQYNPLESNNIIAHFGVNGAEPDNHIGFWYTTYSTGDYKQVDSNRTNLVYQAWGGVDFGGNHWRGAGGSPTGTPSSWTDWVNNYGGDGVNDNPDFANNTRLWNDAPYELQSTSPAIDAGTDMTYILQEFEYLPMFYSDRDILGNQRDSQWDIGAFEYGAGAPAVDSLPNAFTFTDVTNAELSQGYESNGVTLAGFDSAWCYAGGQEFTVYQSLEQPPYTWRTAGIRVFPNDIIKVRRTSSSSYSTAVNTTLTVGSRSDTYTITTKSAPAPSGGSKILKTNGGILKDSTGKVIKTQ